MAAVQSKAAGGAQKKTATAAKVSKSIDADGDGARDGGFDHHFRKPIEAKELTKVFEKAVP